MSVAGASASPLEIRLFGTLEVRVGGFPLPPLRSRRGGWLLALLALRYDRAVERDWLAGTLWPDSLDEQARANLRRTLTDLREALGEAAPRLYAPTPQTLRLNLEGATLDVRAFDQAVRQNTSEALETAVRLYRGPLLEGCTEEWALEERLVRAEAYLVALEALAAQALDARNPAQAVPYLRQVVAAEPLRETAQRALMRALFLNGQYAAVTGTYRELRRLLRRELNAEPDPETSALYRQLRSESRQRAAETAALPETAPAAVSSETPPSRPGFLPCPVTNFLGREAELAAITAQLEQARLVTLTGTGGVGKTRLAIQAAANLQDAYEEGVWFVDLAAVTDPGRVPLTVAAVLGVRETAGRSLTEQLLEALADRALLLILDNCEHLVDACARLTDELLRRCPFLQILATSRQALGLTGEVVCRVAPLSFPDSLPEPDTEAVGLLSRYEAARLFLERARATLPDFQPTESQARAILRISRQLDGIPLALELAAARVGILSVEQIARRLDDRFALLVGGSRAALPRQKTLRALLDWSYDLLDAAERRLFARLAVFQDGWTLEAAEAVCADEAPSSLSTEANTALDSLEPEAILETLAALTDKSLVVCEPRAEAARYRMLETVLQYAREKLAATGEVETLPRRHAAYFRQWAQQRSENLSGTQAAEARRAFEAELENIRKGMDWTLGREPEATVAYGLALFGFLRLRGHYSECDLRLEQAIQAARDGGDLAAVARLLNQRGLVAWERFQLDRARELFAESYAISETLDDKPRMLSALVNLGNVAWGHSDYSAAQEVYTRALNLALETGQTRHEATLRLNLGTLAIERGDYPAAQRFLEASLEMHRRQENDEYVAHSYYNLAELYRHRGEYAAALETTERSRSLYAELGNRRGLALAAVRIALNRLEAGGPEEAIEPAQEGLRIAQEIGDKAGEMYALEVLARLASQAARRSEAETLFQRSLEIALQVGDRKHLLQTVAHYGNARFAAGDSETAYRLLRLARREAAALGLTDYALENRLQEAAGRLTSKERAQCEANPLTVEALCGLTPLPG